MRILQKIPKQKNIIVFESFLGKQYSDSPKAIFEEWRNNYPDDYLVWSINSKMSIQLPSDTVSVERFSLKWVYYMARARVWISNSRLPNWLPKDSNTIYLQTWHGTPLKKLALDMNAVHMPGTNTERYKASFSRETKKWDYLISPNEYSSKIFRRAFAFNQELLEIGYPRNDLFYNHQKLHEVMNNVKKKLHLPEDKKIILYAPTWRDQQNEGRGNYRFQIPFDFKKFSSRYGNEYVLLVRFHYLVSEQLNLESVYPHVIDVSNYPDIAELYTISDLLITDYSSVMFDYAHLKRPMLFYVYDLEQYRDEIRGFYMDFTKEAPGPLVRNENELYQALDNLNDFNDEFLEKFNKFYNRFCEYDDGNASSRVVELLALEIKKNI